MSDVNKAKAKGQSSKEGDCLDVFSARRKLLKGSAFAVPVIMTLKSGALMAASSTGSCITRDQKFADNENPAKFKNSNSDSFLRTEVTIARLIRIKIDADTSKWIYDKKTDGTLRKSKVYVHGHDLATMPIAWEKSGNLYTRHTSPPDDIIDVYDVTTEDPVIVASNRFSDGTYDYVLDTGFSVDGYAEKQGLVVTSRLGSVVTDELGGAKVDRFVDHSDLTDNTNHLTGSCWSSLIPTSP